MPCHSYGDQPFKDKTGQQTVDYIEAENRLPMPEKVGLETSTFTELFPRNRIMSTVSC